MQTAVTAPAGVDAHYESLERNDEMRERVKVACKTKKKKRKCICKAIFFKGKDAFGAGKYLSQGRYFCALEPLKDTLVS